MQRTLFGDPRPRGFSEISEAVAELEMEPIDCRAVVEEEKDDDGYGGTGWTATVKFFDADGELKEFSTLAYENKGLLLDDLSAVGIIEIDEQ